MTANYNGELYENYGDSNLDPCHASTSASSSSSTATLGFESNHMANASTARRPGYCARPGNKHVGQNGLQFSSPPSSCQIVTFRRDLPHVDHAPDEDFEIYELSHHSMGDSDPNEHPALSLSNFASNWQDSQISLEPLSLPLSHHHRMNDDGIYPNMNLGFSRARKLSDDLENMGSILSDDEYSSEPTSPENVSMMRPYPPFLHIPPNRWTASPESVDTDLDDPGLDDASETSSLSPPYEDDVELGHRFLEPEEDDGMTNNDRERQQQQQQQRYHPLDEYPSPFPLQLYNKNNDEHSNTHPQSNTILSSPLPTLSDSPPTPSLSPSSLSSTSPCSSPSSSPPPSSDFVTDTEPATFELEPLGLGPLEPLPLPPPHFTHDHDPISHDGSIISHQETTPSRSITNSSLLYPPFYDFRNDDYSSSSELPCSPSRRRSMALPSLESENENEESTCDSLGLQQFNQFDNNNSFGLQNSAQPPKTKSHWLSLPGCDVDDDLIPMDLASKNYVPDASIVVQSTPLIPKNGTRSLLMWEPSPVHTSAFSPSPSLGSPSRFPSLFDLNATPAPIPRSPSPGDELAELERELALNPHKLSELAPEGAEEEVARLVELRRRQRSLSKRYSRENYTKEERERERERCRELSTLLRLKLRLDERSKGGAEHADSASTPRRSASFPAPSSPTSEATYPQQSSSPSTLPKRSNSYCTSSSPSSKHKITSMAQLVANMVFHRQQEAMKKHSHSPSLTSSSTPNFTPQSYPSSASTSPLTHFTSVGSVTSPKQLTMRTPRSPLRQMTLPMDLEMSSELEGVPECNEGEAETGPLSPLVLTSSPLSYNLRDIAPATAPATDAC